jgi:heptosyltransferase III
VGSFLESLPYGGRVSVIRLRSLGDCVLTTPALELLKQHRPDLEIAVVVENRFHDIFEGNPHIDRILPPDLPVLRRYRPHLCLNFHGGTRSAWLTTLSGARYRAGFAHFRHAFLYNLRIPRAQQILGEQRTVHTAEHLASAMFYLGVPVTSVPRAKLSAELRHEPCAVIHPAASAAAKTWPAARFAEVAREIETSGLDVIFIAGAGDDLSLFREFRTLQGAPLSEIKSLLASAHIFLGNDSGPAHIAAAFAVPSVVLFGTSDPAIWGPWRTASQVLRDPGGIAAIPTSRVLDAVSRLRVHA